jgi:hypothetical protein
VGNNEDNLMARDLKASHHHEDTRCVLPESYCAEGGRCPSVASDGTNKTSGTKMRKRQLQCLEESAEENKKIRKLLTASIRGDSLRNCADALRNEIRSIESHEIANAQLLSNCLEREDSQNNLRRTYKLQHCKAAGNPDEQEILVRIMEDISENLASFSSEIATIRDKATALSEELFAKQHRLLTYEQRLLIHEKRLLIYENGDINDKYERDRRRSGSASSTTRDRSI